LFLIITRRPVVKRSSTNPKITSSLPAKKVPERLRVIQSAAVSIPPTMPGIQSDGNRLRRFIASLSSVIAIVI